MVQFPRDDIAAAMPRFSLKACVQSQCQAAWPRLSSPKIIVDISSCLKRQKAQAITSMETSTACRTPGIWLSMRIPTCCPRFSISNKWQAIDDRKFGIGNISVAEGMAYDKHKSHQKGIEMDIRPVRKDKLTGQAARVSRFDEVYDTGMPRSN